MSTVPINDTAPRVQYVASAAQTVFAYPFWITSNQDLDVYVDGVLQTLTTDYTVSGILNSSGGDVTFVVGINAAQIVTIERNMAFERVSEFQEAGTFKAGVLNLELSKMVGMMQQLKRDIGRKVGLSPTSLVNQASLLLPDPVDGKALVFDGTNGAMRTSGVNVDDIDSAVTAASTSAANALASETNAAASLSAAQTAQTNAETAETNAESARDAALAAVGSVKVSANDTTPSDLETKITAGTGIALTTLNDGANEQLEVSSTITPTAQKVKAWGKWNGSTTITYSEGISSISSAGTGIILVNFTSNILASPHTLLVSAGTGTGQARIINVENVTDSQVKIRVRDQNILPVAPHDVFITVIGS